MGIVHSHEDEGKLASLKKCYTRHFHISHNVPYLPLNILHNLCFSFLLGITAVPREIEDSACAKFGGQIRCIMGIVEVAYSTKPSFLLFIRHLYIFHNTPGVRQTQTADLQTGR